MKRFFKKKWVIALLVVIFLGLAGGGFYMYQHKKTNTASAPSQPSDNKTVSSIPEYLAGQSDYSTFNSFISQMDLKAKLTPNAAGASPKYIMFAANNAAFQDPEVKDPFQALTPAQLDEFRAYYVVALYPDANGVQPSTDLTDGQRLTTLGGRNLLVKKSDNKLVIVDVKGREAILDKKYVTSTNGDKLYFIDKLLLLQ